MLGQLPDRPRRRQPCAAIDEGTLDLFVDASFGTNERMAFNAGSLTDSIVMSARDYLDLVEPTIFDFSKEAS